MDRVSFVFFTVGQRQMHTEYRSHQPVVSPALCSTHGSCNLDVPDIPPTYNYVVNEMPMFESGVHPGGLVFGCHSEELVSDGEVIFSTHS